MDVRKGQPVQFHYLVKGFHFPRRTDLKNFIVRLFEKEGYQPGSLNYIFCTDKYLLSLNKDFLKHNTFTDIITFQYTSKPHPISADIYISIDRVRENANLFQNSFHVELMRVIIHGALHCCGYTDKGKKQTELMRDMENRYLKKMFHVK